MDIAHGTVGLQPVALQQGAQSIGFFLRGSIGAPVIVDGYYSSNNQLGSVGIVDTATDGSVDCCAARRRCCTAQATPAA